MCLRLMLGRRGEAENVPAERSHERIRRQAAHISVANMASMGYYEHWQLGETGAHAL